MNDDKATETGEVISPLPNPDSNFDKACFYITMAERTDVSARVRAICKAIHFLNKELKKYE